MTDEQTRVIHELARNIVYTLGADPGSITAVERMLREAFAKVVEEPRKAA